MGLSFTKFINESGSLIFATAISNEHTKHSGWSLLRLVEISRSIWSTTDINNVYRINMYKIEDIQKTHEYIY